MPSSHALSRSLSALISVNSESHVIVLGFSYVFGFQKLCKSLAGSQQKETVLTNSAGQHMTPVITHEGVNQQVVALN